MTTQAARFQHPGALKEAQRLISEALDSGATHLDLSELRLRYLPDELALLAGQLTSLDLSHCKALNSLTGIEQLKALTSLNVHWCRALTSLTGIEPLKALTSLNVHWCEALISLAGIEQLQALTALEVSKCEALTSLAGIEQLQALITLEVSGCEALTSLAGIEQLQALTTLEVSGCEALTSLAGVEQLQDLTSLNVCGCIALTSFVGMEQLQALTSLDVSWCQALTSLAGIEQLQTLTSLNLSGCQALTNLAGIEQLQTLTSLNLSGCQSLSSLAGIEQLQALTSLDVSWCEALTSLVGIEQCQTLTSLNVRACNALTSLAGIEQLHALESLDVSGSHTINSLEGIARLPALTSLDVSRCKALSSLAGIEQLQALTSLNVSGCEELASLVGIEQLTALTSLNVSESQVLMSLAGISQLQALTWLDVSGCPSLTSLKGIEQLHALTSLDLSECKALISLAGIKQLQALILLDLSGCEALTNLADIEQLTTLTRLTIFGCSVTLPLHIAQHLLLLSPRLRLFADALVIEHLPPELTNQFNQTAFEDWWFAGQQSGFAPAKQLKVMLLGNGRIGKTQLARRLRGEPFDQKVPSTHGIQLHSVSWTQLFGSHGTLPPAIDPLYAEMQLHCWDFGGQDLYLGTHSLFLDHQAVYLLLWHPDAENTKLAPCEKLQIRNRPLSYWLAYLKSLVGDNANILLCQSQCDDPTQHQHAPVPNPSPFKALRQLDISSKTMDGLEQFYPTFKKALQQQLLSNGEIWLPNSWLAVEQDIRQLIAERPELKQLHYEDFVRLCDQHQVTAPETLANYLHQSGVVFYRNGHFNNQLILDQQWALQGVYLLLERDHVQPELQARKGQFDVATLERWLEKQQLNSADLPLFLEMMQQCGTCFQVNETHFIAPDNLPEFDNNQAIQTWHDTEPESEIELSYSFLHDATMRYLLSKIGEVAKEHAYYWRYGCCFYDQKHKTKVWFECQLLPVNTEHLQNYSQPGVIRLRFAGQQCVALAQHLVDSITQSSHLGQLPDVKWLKGQPLKSKDDKAEHDSAEPFSALGPASPPPKTPAIYFSYAWGTEQDPRQQVSDQLYEQLVNLYGAKNVFRDKNYMRLGESIEAFEREIGRAPLVLVVISKAYLESKHCLNELRLIYEYCQKDKSRFWQKVIPVVLADAGIDDDIKSLEYLRDWQQKRKQLQELADQLTDNTGAAQKAKLQNYVAIEHCLDHCLGWLADPLTERQPELQVEATITLVKNKVALWTEKH